MWETIAQCIIVIVGAFMFVAFFENVFKIGNILNVQEKILKQNEEIIKVLTEIKNK